MADNIKKVAIAICEADGVDPFKVAVGLGKTMPAGQQYQLWEAREKQAQAALKVMGII